MHVKHAYLGFSRSRHQSFVWWCVSATTFGISAVWMQTAGSASVADAFFDRLVIGWMGLFIAAGCAVAGFLCWPRHSDLAWHKGTHSISAYDSVTGLPMLRLYRILLAHALSRAEVTMRHVGVLVCALEQFRPLATSSTAPNMTLGVRVQAARIKSALQPHDVVARLDDSTFAVIADNLDSPDEARSIAQRIQHAVALPLSIEGQELLISCRIGGVVGGRQGAKAEVLLDAAMEVLENGRLSEEGTTLITVAPQPWATSQDVSVPSPISDRSEISLISHR